MVSSVLVELVGDAGEAPSSTEFCCEVFENISCRCVAAGVGEEDIAGMEVKGHVTGIPVLGLGTHSVESGETGHPPKFIKSAI